MLRFSSILSCCISALFANSTYAAYVLDIDANSVEAAAWVIYDPQSKQVIAAHNETAQRAPASLTKMMVGYLALQAIQQGTLQRDQIVTVPEVVRTVKWDESRLKLQPNDKITVEELIAGLIIMSANDAALTLAELISGDVAQFLQLMNSTAAQLGMQHSHFSNPSGITMQAHYASALDLALLSQAIVKETPEYLYYSKQPEFNFQDIHHEATNILLKIDPSVDGLKTGYTAAAGYNLALSANRLDQHTNTYRRLIVIVMGSNSIQKRAEIAHKLLNIGYNYTQTAPLFNREQKLAQIPVVNGKKLYYQVNLAAQHSYNTLSLLPSQQQLNLQQFDNTQQRFVLNSSNSETLTPLLEPTHIDIQVKLLAPQLTAPLYEQQFPLAHIELSQFNQPIHAISVQQDIELEQIDWWQRLFLQFKHLIQRLFGKSDNKALIYPITAE